MEDKLLRVFAVDMSFEVDSSSWTSMKKKWSTFLFISRALERFGWLTCDRRDVRRSYPGIARRDRRIADLTISFGDVEIATAYSNYQSNDPYEEVHDPSTKLASPFPCTPSIAPLTNPSAELRGHSSDPDNHRPLFISSKVKFVTADLRVLESYQNSVFSDSTANLSGMTSTAKYAPRSKTCRSSSGMNFFQMLLVSSGLAEC